MTPSRFLSLLLPFILISCAGEERTEIAAEAMEFKPSVASNVDVSASERIQATNIQFEERAFPAVAARWSKLADDGRVLPVTIPVCWETAAMAETQEVGRATVQRAASDQWASNSLITFSGWRQCVDGNRGIRILVDDSGPHVKALGKNLDGVKNGMVLNFTYQNWSPSCQDTIENCNYVIAVHEFGHALFFAHEQNRPDTPGECSKAPQGSDGDVLLTPWDWQSVMNYCNPIYGNDGQLSEWDLFALQRFYGKPT